MGYDRHIFCHRLADCRGGVYRLCLGIPAGKGHRQIPPFETVQKGDEMKSENAFAPRNKYTRNRYDVFPEYVIGYVYNRKSQEVGTFRIDTEDFGKVKAWKWCRNADGYIITWKDGRIQYLHHIITNHTPNPLSIIDHLNQDRSDNRKSNLRICSRSINAMNSNFIRGASKYRGVYYDKSRNRYCSRLLKDGQLVLFKRFKTEEEAAEAYANAFSIHFREGQDVDERLDMGTIEENRQ